MCRNVEKYSKSHCSGKSVRRYFYEARKKCSSTLMKQKKRLSTNFTKSVRRWPKKCLSIFEKKSVRRPFTT